MKEEEDDAQTRVREGGGKGDEAQARVTEGGGGKGDDAQTRVRVPGG